MFKVSKEKLWKAIEAYRAAGSSEERWRRRDYVDVLIDELTTEPDWSNSETLPTEMWKNTLATFQDRLLIADRAVKFYQEVARNLRVGNQ